MRIYTEQNLPNFNFWAGAKDNAAMLTYSELEQLEFMLEDIYPDGMDETTINDILWFDFEWVCECLGITYNNETGEISREDEE